MRTLRGRLPVCSYDKRMRDSSDEWTPVESYVRALSHAVFSHGICPQCLERHYPDHVP